MNTKSVLFLSLLSLTSINMYGQVAFENHIISDTTGGVTSVYASDLDGDGDLDFLFASSEDTIAWHENIDGQGTFGTQKTIATSVEDGRSVFASDLDGDGDMDVLSASINDNKIAWYENTDGQGNFSAENIISTNANQAHDVYTSDLDGDGDMDVLSASIGDDKIAWYENTDGQGNFGAEQVISTNANSAWSVYSSDLDGDGDMDVLSASTNDDKIAWYENTDGQGSFSAEKIITTNAIAAKAVSASDLDNDGDMDILSASQIDDKIAWYENTDGQGNFSAEKIITTNLDAVTSLFVVDLDNDSDMDVIAGSQNNGKIEWYENTNGLGDFEAVTPAIFYTFPASSIYAADMDNDGDIDVLTSSIQHTIAWHENALITSISQSSLIDFDISPVPTTNTLFIQSEVEIIKIDIYNTLGQLVLTNAYQREINLSTLAQGIYLCVVKDVNDQMGVKTVVKQ